MSLINQPMALLGCEDSLYIPFNDITTEHASDMDETTVQIYTLTGNPITTDLIPGYTRTCTFAQSGKNSAITSDPDSTSDLNLTISAYSTSWSGFPTDIIALEFNNIDSNILNGICGISISGSLTVSNASLTVAAYVGRGMPPTDDVRWTNLLYELRVSETSFNISGGLSCDYQSDGKIYIKLRNVSMVNPWDVSSMFMTITNLSIITKTREDNSNFHIF